MKNVAALYRGRFSDTDRRTKDRVWDVLCKDFFQDYVRPNDTMLDLGCGYGEFSRHIQAAQKFAVDLNPDSAAFLPRKVEFHKADARHLEFLQDGSVDVVFASNFFEHLSDKETMDAVLLELKRVLRAGGRVVVLQPNIRFAPGAYWDFYDHHLPLSERSCAEAFRKAGFAIEELMARFLPFSTQSLLPKHPLLVKAYLKVPLLWNLIGKQFLLVAVRPAE